MINYVLGFATWGDKILLMEKQRGPESLIGKLNGVGGKIEEKESAFVAMLREFKEETGVNTNYVDWTNFGVIQFIGGSKAHLFKIKLDPDIDYYDIKNPEIDEPIAWYSFEDVKHKIVPNLSWIIPLMEDDSTPYVMIKEKEKP